ncbi:MAG: DHHA1 domain-containing protein [Acidobacteria bacterium]|jgi:alanyl-tRNA synthetase|nr:DHHA1 domain-containing protein [Acidobacteriota bacterium]
MTERLHLRDSYLLEFDARVLACRAHGGSPAVVLDRTAFYPESGGQPWDTGTLGEASVVAVVEQDGNVLHVLDRPLAEGPVRGRVDGARRRAHRQQHHGQHLLSQAFVEVAAARTVGFHLGAETTTIDLDRTVNAEQIDAAEARANEVAWEARPVSVKVVSVDEARGLGVAVPEGVDEDVRLVEAEGFDLQPCGGTHPRTTAEVGVVVVTAAERYKGGTRVSFVCGHRALHAVTRRRHVLDRLTSVLSSPLEGLADVAQKTRDDLSASERRARGLLERALEGEARRLLDLARGTTAPRGAEPSIVVAAYDGWSANELRVLAQRLVALSPCVALLGSRAEKAHLVFAQTEGLPHDVPALLREAVGHLGGRGGGRGDLAQGGGDRPELLDEALERAADAVRARS